MAGMTLMQHLPWIPSLTAVAGDCLGFPLLADMEGERLILQMLSAGLYVPGNLASAYQVPLAIVGLLKVHYAGQRNCISCKQLLCRHTLLSMWVHKQIMDWSPSEPKNCVHPSLLCTLTMQVCF